MPQFDKISFPNPNCVDGDTLEFMLDEEFKNHQLPKTYYYREQNETWYELSIIDNYITELLRITIQPRLISLERRNEATREHSETEVSEVYDLVRDLFSKWFIQQNS